MQSILSAFSNREGNVFDRADCAMCDRNDLKPEDFRDEISRREFGISRMCQSCQDSVFGE